jgi:hypothetical protein
VVEVPQILLAAKVALVAVEMDIPTTIQFQQLLERQTQAVGVAVVAMKPQEREVQAS